MRVEVVTRADAYIEVTGGHVAIVELHDLRGRATPEQMVREAEDEDVVEAQDRGRINRLTRGDFLQKRHHVPFPAEFTFPGGIAASTLRCRHGRDGRDGRDGHMIADTVRNVAL
jgi:hypothetical protein